MTTVVCHVSAGAVPAADADDEIHVLLYEGNPVRPGAGAIGGRLREQFSRLGAPPSRVAVDFVSLALAVTAADTFVLRSEAANSWNRDITLVVPLAAPQIWEPVRADLERALRFLSGDDWHFVFQPDGESPPATFEVRARQRGIDLTRVDCVCLFSGGLDSAIGALDLVSGGHRPLLVSHAYRGDAAYQEQVAGLLGQDLQRFAANAWPRRNPITETTMRTRSFNFIAFAVLAAQVRSSLRSGVVTDVVVPENGLIALNAPLTPRRIGALSTRTTHPHYLGAIQSIMDRVGLPVRITNPFETVTKGEMVHRYRDRPKMAEFAAATVSCGVWHRKNQQCGRCVPCLIRRASLYAGSVDDGTSYETPDLHQVLSNEELRDDLVGMLTAVRRLKTNNLERWVSQAGPLPFDVGYRASLIDVHRRGLTEVASFLRDSGFPT